MRPWRIDDRSRILLLVLALVGLIPRALTHIILTMSHDVADPTVLRVMDVPNGEVVTVVQWVRYPTDPALTYRRVWRIGATARADDPFQSGPSARALEPRTIGTNTVLDPSNGPTCYVLEPRCWYGERAAD